MKIDNAPPRILIVDDNPVNIELLKDSLKEEYALFAARNGDSGLKLAKGPVPPDLILLDIIMPGMDGYEVCRQLKLDAATRNIPVIFVTARSSAGDEAKGFERGAVDYIIKPISPEIVKARIKMHLELKKYRDHLEAVVAERTSELEMAKTLAEEASRVKGQIIKNMGHELRTPLNGILSSAEIGRTYDVSEEVKRIFNKIESSSTKLLKVINGILNFSQSEDGTLTLTEECFRLDELLADLPLRFEHKGVEREIEITFAPVENPFENDIPNALYGDPEKLKEIFYYLLDNAAKFSAQKTVVTLKIQVLKVSLQSVTYAFQVADNGIGIGKEHYHAIFDSFMQIDNSECRKYDGAGMGLAITKRLVGLMGGDISLTSIPGEGSAFTFSCVFKRQKTDIPFVMPEYGTTQPFANKRAFERKKVDREALEKVFYKLATALESMDPLGTSLYLKQAHEYIDSTKLAKIAAYIDGYDFEEALCELYMVAGEIGFAHFRHGGSL